MKTFKFFGVDGNCYKLDDSVWEAIEDPSDGYRSYLETIELKEDTKNLIFFPDPIATVYVKEITGEAGLSGYRLVDSVDGHIWLFIGTDNYDDYYPCFRFEYTAKPPKTTWESFIKD